MEVDLSLSTPVTQDGYWKQKITNHLDFLKEFLEPRFGILNELIARSILSRGSIDTVKAEKTTEAKNEQLLKLIQTNNKEAELIVILREQNQQHIVNYISYDGKISKNEDCWPLTEAERNKLNSNQVYLTKNIDIDKLIDELVEGCIINGSQWEFIKSSPTLYEKNELFLDILYRRSLRDYNETIHCLRKTNQDRIAKVLEIRGEVQAAIHENNKNDSAVEITYECIQQHKDFLIERLDPGCILEKLFSEKLITFRVMSEIQKSVSPFKRAEELINTVLEKNLISSFVKAMNETNQIHLSNYLSGNGVYDQEQWGDDWPITEDQKNILDTNYGHLIEIIEPNNLLSQLIALKVLSARQEATITRDSNNIERNKAILHMFRCGSRRDYKMFILGLQMSDQTNVAENLLEGGVLLKLRATIDGEPEEVSQYEDQVSLGIARILIDRPLEEIQRILQLTQLRVVKVQKGK